MKYKPRDIVNETKYTYLVTLDGEEYVTKAYNSVATISNAAYRHSQELNENVGLIKWKVNEGEIECTVEEITEK